MGEVVLKDNMTINYFAERQHTEKILKEIEKMIKKMFLLHGVQFVQKIYDL